METRHAWPALKHFRLFASPAKNAINSEDPNRKAGLDASNVRQIVACGQKLFGVRWQKEMLSNQSFAADQDERPVPQANNDNSSTAADLAPNLALPWVVRLRYGVVAGEAAIVLGMFYGFRLRFPLVWMLAPLALILASNIVLGRLRVLPLRFPQQTLGAVFCLDTLCLTVMLGLTGGATNPFSLLYLVQITLSAVVLRKMWTWVLGALSTVCFGLLFFFQRTVARISNPPRGVGVVAAPGRDVDCLRDRGRADHVFYRKNRGRAANAGTGGVHAAGSDRKERESGVSRRLWRRAPLMSSERRSEPSPSWRGNWSGTPRMSRATLRFWRMRNSSGPRWSDAGASWSG